MGILSRGFDRAYSFRAGDLHICLAYTERVTLCDITSCDSAGRDVCGGGAELCIPALIPSHKSWRNLETPYCGPLKKKGVWFIYESLLARMV